MNWKNILARAGWAALSAFVAAFTVPAVLTDVAGWQAAALAGATAAVAAFVSAVKTIVQEVVVGTTSVSVNVE